MFRTAAAISFTIATIAVTGAIEPSGLATAAIPVDVGGGSHRVASESDPQAHYIAEGIYEATGPTATPNTCNWLLIENRPNNLPWAVRTGLPLMSPPGPRPEFSGPLSAPVYRTAETLRDPTGQTYTSFQTDPSCGTWTFTPPATSIVTDGEYVIGAAIKPGTYVTSGAATAGSQCSYRLSEVGEPNAFGPWTVAPRGRGATAPLTDWERGRVLSTSGCAPWTRQNDPAVDPGPAGSTGLIFGS
ncbi:hypothetical protein Br6_05228 [Rhodococcus sp. Br-6]|nr:hypothetical protein Br6_05228 [Rhodococcus sp. Br-6]